MTQLTITGNVVADPELRVIPSGKAIATFTVVSSKSVKQADGSWENTDTTFWDIKCWGKTAENVADSVQKGMSVIVVGTAVQENWDDKATGAKRSKIAVTAWNVGIDLSAMSPRQALFSVQMLHSTLLRLTRGALHSVRMLRLSNHRIVC
jgi:single-strand DNA-binding protein